jgi:hypothetical protein
MIRGTIVTHDPQYGNIWTNIDQNLLKKYGVKVNGRYKVTIYHKKVEKYSGTLTYHNTFGETLKGSDLLYLNSLFNLAIGKNQGNFATKYHIGSGPDWVITVAAQEKLSA